MWVERAVRGRKRETRRIQHPFFKKTLWEGGEGRFFFNVQSGTEGVYLKIFIKNFQNFSLLELFLIGMTFFD